MPGVPVMTILGSVRSAEEVEGDDAFTMMYTNAVEWFEFKKARSKYGTPLLNSLHGVIESDPRTPEQKDSTVLLGLALG